MEPTLNSPRVSEQSSLPHSGACNSGHLMAGQANQERQHPQVYSEALWCTSSFIRALDKSLLSACEARCFAKQQAFHNRDARSSTTRGRRRRVGGLTERGVGGRHNDEEVQDRSGQLKSSVSSPLCMPSPAEAAEPPWAPTILSAWVQSRISLLPSLLLSGLPLR